jgi:hypothetical protein
MKKIINIKRKFVGVDAVNTFVNASGGHAEYAFYTDT